MKANMTCETPFKKVKIRKQNILNIYINILIVF